MSLVYLYTMYVAAIYGSSGEKFVPTEATAYPADFDCPMRQLALEFAIDIQPNLSKYQLQEIADALNGAEESVNKTCVNVPSNWEKKHHEAPVWDDLNDIYDESAAPSIFVDFNKGNDRNDGSLKSPLKHLDSAIDLARTLYGADTYKRIILREGRHYLRKTVYISSVDNNLLITNLNHENVELSGATPIHCTWEKTIKADNIYQCKITDDNINVIEGLRIDGARAIRARYPNGNPEVFPCGFCSDLTAPRWVPPSCAQKPDTEYHPSEPLRNTTQSNWFEQYQLGVGGCCDGFTPPAGYWCGNETQGGGAFTYLIPSGINYTARLPNAPYLDITGGVIQAWRPGHWSSWMFEMDPTNYDPSQSIIMFKKGGFQGARGSKAGAEFFVENIFEEMDYPTEWYFNTTTKVLYYVQNGSGTPDNIVFEATNLKVLLNYTGTMQKPVENQVVRGMTMRDTQITFLDAHGMPSGGDWGLQRTGAIYLDGVRNVTISNNRMTRLDGNAISVNRYARDVVISDNEIVWNGDSAVTMWGDTENIPFPDGTTMGYDGTNGNQPRGTILRSNFVHEIGIWEKQSSMWFQAKSCNNILENNIFFNGPRAGINFNDGFGGNSTLRKNLLFNTCRESGDHGPFNSWDRQVYVTKVRDGTPSTIKEYDHIYHNFMVSDYSAGFAIDNDDGSCYYDTHDNFFVYGGTGMKNDFGGHDNHHYNNIYAYISKNCFSINGQIEGHHDVFSNNTCIIHKDAPSTYGNFDCNAQNAGNQWPKFGDNTIYQMSANTSATGLCGIDEKAFQQKYSGADDGTTIYGPPNNAEILQKAKNLIF